MGGKGKNKDLKNRGEGDKNVGSKKKVSGTKIKADGGISTIQMTNQEEEMLLKLIKMLDAGEFDVNLAADVGMADGSSDSDDDDDEDEDDGYSENEGSASEDSDDDDDDDDSDDVVEMTSSKKTTPAALQNSKAVLTFTDQQRRSLVRRLIRNDRILTLNLETKTKEEKKSKDLVVKSIMSVEKSKGNDLSGPAHKKSGNSQPRVSSALRLTISCAKKIGSIVPMGPSKLVLADRKDSLDEVVLAARNKFAASKKFSELLIMPDGTQLTDDDMSTLNNDCHLLLVIGGGPKKAQLSTAGRKEADTSVKKIDSETVVKIADEYWSPPEINYSDQVLKTPRVVGDIAQSQILFEKQKTMLALPSYNDILLKRQSLPIFELKEHLLSSIRNNQSIVVSGETGSGKTSQLPAYILEDMYSRGLGGEAFIICTQPRRIAAISIAERVAYERMETVGNTVGYQVRLNSCCGPNTRILFCTTGVLLRRMQHPDFLSSVSHIMVDEVHERQLDTDFLIALLKERIVQYPHLRLILMSATMEEGLFSEYLSCPIEYVFGRCFPVKEHYLEEIQKLVGIQQKLQAKESPKKFTDPKGNVKDRSFKGKGSEHVGWDDGRDARLYSAGGSRVPHRPKFDAELIAEAVIRIIQTHSQRNRSGVFQVALSSLKTSETGDAILVFLDGIASITKVSRALRQRNMNSLNAEVLMLHSSLGTEIQRKAFKKTKPGEWKIVLSTNIAETSLTIEDVTHVLDCGTVKEMRYDAEANMSSLKEVVISRASAKQRAGRAGRVKPGHCWRLYSAEFLASDLVDDQPAPEIKRVPLEEVVLQVLLLKLGLPEQFLSKCLEPPSMGQVKASVNCLLEIKAILPKPTLPLTALGYHLAQMPVDVRVGKMLINASLLNCIEPALTIAAALSGKSPFTTPPNLREEATRAHKTFISTHNTAMATEQYFAPTKSSGALSQHLTPFNDAFFSDHLACVSAFNLWYRILQEHGEKTAYSFCRDKYLSHNILTEIMRLRENFKGHLRSAGFLAPESSSGEFQELDEIDDSEYDPSSVTPDTSRFLKLPIVPAAESRTDLVRCALCAGLSTNIVRVSRFEDPTKKAARQAKDIRRKKEDAPLHIMQRDGVEVHVHPSSLTHGLLKYLLEGGQGSGQGLRTGRMKDAYIVYHKKFASGKVLMYDCTAVSPTAVLLFGGDVRISSVRKSSTTSGVVVTIGSWMHFKMSELHGVLIRRLQWEIESLLRTKVEDPSRDVSKRQAVLARVVETLLG